MPLEKILPRLKRKNIWTNVLCYENNFVYSVRISDEKFENYMDLLIITNKNKSNYDYIKEGIKNNN